MTIKKAYFGEFRHLLSILRLASRDNRSYVAFPARKFQHINFLNNLHEQGFIESFEIKNEFLIIWLKQTYWKSFQLPVNSISEIKTTTGRLKSDRSRKCLEKKYIRKGAFLCSLISTDYGSISSAEAVSKKLGGLPLFDII